MIVRARTVVSDYLTILEKVSTLYLSYVLFHSAGFPASNFFGYT